MQRGRSNSLQPAHSSSLRRRVIDGVDGRKAGNGGVVVDSDGIPPGGIRSRDRGRAVAANVNIGGSRVGKNNLRAGGGALESQGLDRIENSDAVADAGDSYFPKGSLIQIEEDVATDVVGAKRGRVYCALVLAEPASDVGVVPLVDKVCIREVGWCF